MFRDIVTVFKKEIKSIIKDKSILLMCVLLPALFMFGEGKLMEMMGNQDNADKEYNAYVVNAPEYTKSALTELGFKGEPENREQCIEDIKNKKAELLVVFPEDFTTEPQEGKAASDIEVWYNSSNMDSLQMKEKFSYFLDSIRPVSFTIDANPNNTYDLGDETYLQRNAMASMVPGLLIMMIIYGILPLASSIIAGDKESNFLNTVLITPVSRSSVAIGKALAVLSAAAVSAVSAFVGLSFLMKSFSKIVGEAIINYSAIDYVYVFVCILSVAFAIVGLILILSTIAKTTRSAQSLSVIPMMVLFIGSFLTSNSSFDGLINRIGFINCLIPMWNATYVTKAVLLKQFSFTDIATTCVINIVFGVICLFIVSRLFNNEKIVND